MRQQFVEINFAQDRPQRRLRKLRGLVHVIRNRNYGLVGIDHAQEDDRVYLQRDVVTRDDVLRRNFQRLLPQRDAHNAIDRREHQNDARTFGHAQQAAKAKNDAAFILGQNFDRVDDVESDDDDDNNASNTGHSVPPAQLKCRTSATANCRLIARGTQVGNSSGWWLGVSGVDQRPRRFFIPAFVGKWFAIEGIVRDRICATVSRRSLQRHESREARRNKKAHRFSGGRH